MSEKKSRAAIALTVITSIFDRSKKTIETEKAYESTGKEPAYLKDTKGRLVPVSSIKPEILAQHYLVENEFDIWNTTNSLIAEQKTDTWNRLCQFIEMLGKGNGSNMTADDIGNLSLPNFDQTKKITFSVAKVWRFNADIWGAKKLLEQIIELNGNKHGPLRAMAMGLFADDQLGKLDVEAIWRLTKFDTSGWDAKELDLWNAAISIIEKSREVQNTKSYIRFHWRKTPKDAWQHLTISFADAPILDDEQESAV